MGAPVIVKVQFEPTLYPPDVVRIAAAVCVTDGAAPVCETMNFRGGAD